MQGDIAKMMSMPVEDIIKDIKKEVGGEGKTFDYSGSLDFLEHIKNNIDEEMAFLRSINPDSFYLVHEDHRDSWILVKFECATTLTSFDLRWYAYFRIVASEKNISGRIVKNAHSSVKFLEVPDNKLPLYIKGLYRSSEFDEKLKSL